jgi:hypothetical protein
MLRLQLHLLFFRNDPDSMHNSGDVPEDGQQDVDPKMFAQTFLQEHTKRRQQDCDNDP